MDKGGWVHVDDVLSWFQRRKRTKLRLEDIQDMVDLDQKRRYELEQDRDGFWIRASQGHTMRRVEDK
jgi:RNA:NAD 2'-phosphotransferase (TPT1/KptA family)